MSVSDDDDEPKDHQLKVTLVGDGTAGKVTFELIASRDIVGGIF